MAQVRFENLHDYPSSMNLRSGQRVRIALTGHFGAIVDLLGNKAGDFSVDTFEATPLETVSTEEQMLDNNAARSRDGSLFVMPTTKPAP